MPAPRILRFARTSRCAIAGSATRNACAISPVVSPPTSRSVSATRLSAASAGWQQVKTSARRSSGIALTSSSSAGSSCRRPMSSALRWKTFSRRMRSIARLRAVVTIHAPGVAWHPLTRPALECRGERVLHGVLGELEVAEDAREDRDGTAPLLAEDPLDLALHPRYRTAIDDRADLDRAVLRRGDERREPDRLVEVGEVDEEDATEDLLRLREGTVGDDALAVAHLHDLGGAAPVELLARRVRIGLAELLEERAPLRHLRRAELRLLLVGKIHPRGVVAVDEQRVLHSCTSSGSTYTGRTSTAPCSAPGIRAAQSTASSIDSHSRR